MPEPILPDLDRRDLCLAGIGVGLVAMATPATSQPVAAPKLEARGGFAFQTGEWRVRHRKLRQRLKGSTDWAEFDGTCRAWEIADGLANIEDNFLDDPVGAYRAFAVRRVDPATGLWSIWWFDMRYGGGAGTPVTGGFKDGVGRFYADDEHEGRPIRMRFIWSGITPTAAHWEQAFSPDGGRNWETNWTMAFSRV